MNTPGNGVMCLATLLTRIAEELRPGRRNSTEWGVITRLPSARLHTIRMRAARSFSCGYRYPIKLHGLRRWAGLAGLEVGGALDVFSEAKSRACGPSVDPLRALQQFPSFLTLYPAQPPSTSLNPTLPRPIGSWLGLSRVCTCVPLSSRV